MSTAEISQKAVSKQGLGSSAFGVAQKLGRADEAVQHYEHALQLDPSQKDAGSALAQMRTTGWK